MKGPLRCAEDAHRSTQMAKWKDANGLPAVEQRLEYLLPNRWPEGVPLGVRNSLDRGEPAPFLVSRSLVDLASLRKRIHSSKLWPPTEVVDPAATNHHMNLNRFTELSEQEKEDYVLALFARYVFGASDLGDRNFVRANGRVFSVDEETRRPDDISFVRELGCRRIVPVATWVDQNWPAIFSKVSSWTQIPKERYAFWEAACDRAQVAALFGQG